MMKCLPLLFLLIGGTASSLFNFLELATNAPLPSIPKSTVAPVNVSCRIQPFSKCFLGACPAGFTCLSSDTCCPDTDLNIPTPDCQDFLEGCESINCEAKNIYEFARVNCAKSCNFCNNVPLPPKYNCNDVLPDCQQRANVCTVRGFETMMALYCPRTCEVCDYVDDSVPCGDMISNCTGLGQNFCDSVKTSAFQLRAGCGKTCSQC